jgi:hypothetical protein
MLSLRPRHSRAARTDAAMSFDSNDERRLDALQAHLRCARTITPDLAAHVIAQACPRFQARHSHARAKVLGLLECGARTDAALALLEWELPSWKLRRLIYDDGEWHCSLSKQLWVPAELDDLAEAAHENLPLAVLSALVEARRISLTTVAVRPKSVPQIRATSGHVLCSDNFT